MTTVTERRCQLCPRPVLLVADAEPFMATVVYRGGEVVRTREGRPYVALAHASCWFANHHGSPAPRQP